MTIKIGDREFATQRPNDLDAKLIEATGCTAAEHRNMLASGAPSQIASAIAPLMTEKISTEELAQAIYEGDTVAIIQQARELLDVPPVADAPPVAVSQHFEAVQ